jgi:hypothetical protein
VQSVGCGYKSDLAVSGHANEGTFLRFAKSSSTSLNSALESVVVGDNVALA